VLVPLVHVPHSHLNGGNQVGAARSDQQRLDDDDGGGRGGTSIVPAVMNRRPTWFLVLAGVGMAACSGGPAGPSGAGGRAAGGAGGTGTAGSTVSAGGGGGGRAGDAGGRGGGRAGSAGGGSPSSASGGHAGTGVGGQSVGNGGAGGNGGNGAAGSPGACTAQAPLTPAAFFPYQVGARWMFEGHGSTPGLASLDLTFVQERSITGTKPIGGDSALVLWNSNTNESSEGELEEYVNVSAGGLVNYGTSADRLLTGMELPFPLPAYTEVPFPIDVCGTFVAFDVPAQDTGRDIDGDGVNETIALHATTSIRLEDVAVPVGSFPGALRIERNIVTTEMLSRSHAASQATQTQVDWYAAGIGPIKRTASQGGRLYQFDLIAYDAGGVAHGFMPPSMLARNLSQEFGAVENGEASAAIGFDGKNFLAVAPIGSITYSSNIPGGLQGYVIAPDGTTLSSGPLLDASETTSYPSIAFDGTRYLVSYVNTGWGRVEALIVSPAGSTLDGPIVLSKDPPTVPPNVPPSQPDTGGSPAAVATKSGFLVGYTKGRMTNTGLTSPNLWLSPVDSTGHPGAAVVPFPDGAQGHAVLATDGTTLLAVWPQQSMQDLAIYGVRLDGTGHALDSAPFPIAPPQPDMIENLQVIFDGTQFVALWAVRASSTSTTHVVRIGIDGSLKDPPGGLTVGIPAGGSNGPCLSRLGTGSVIVWARNVVISQFRYGLAATRFTADGRLLDVPPGTDEFIVEGPLAAMPFAEYPHPSMAWGADRALMIWSAGTGNNDISGYDLAPVLPW